MARIRPVFSARAALAVLALVALLSGLSPRPAHCAQGFGDLIWITEEYYPYNFSEEGRLRGISVDLLHMVWKELGEPGHPIAMQPWARGYKAALDTPGTVLFSTARTAEREELFKWAGPIAHVRFVLAAPRSAGLHLDGPEDLAGLSVGTLREDVSDQLLDPWRRICRVEPVASMDLNMRKLDAGRIDMVAYEETSLRLLLMHEGRDPDEFEVLHVLREVPIHYAFHKTTDDALVARFQRALDDVKDTPEYAKLLYGYVR